MFEQELPASPAQDKVLEDKGPVADQPKILGKLKKLASRKKPARTRSTPQPTAIEPEGDLAAARARFEEQRMTRRAALRRFGMVAGIGAFHMLSVDDLARACLSRLHEHEFTREVADTLAAELGNSGMAVAATAAGSYGYGIV